MTFTDSSHFNGQGSNSLVCEYIFFHVIALFIVYLPQEIKWLGLKMKKLKSGNLTFIWVANTHSPYNL